MEQNWSPAQDHLISWWHSWSEGSSCEEDQPSGMLVNEKHPPPSVRWWRLRTHASPSQKMIFAMKICASKVGWSARGMSSASWGVISASGRMLSTSDRRHTISGQMSSDSGKKCQYLDELLQFLDGRVQVRLKFRTNKQNRNHLGNVMKHKTGSDVMSFLRMTRGAIHLSCHCRSMSKSRHSWRRSEEGWAN